MKDPDDLLARSDYLRAIDSYVAYTSANVAGDESVILALNGVWGHGKTFVLRMLEADLRRRESATVYFDSWRMDYYREPLIPLLAAILDELKKEGSHSQTVINLKSLSMKMAKAAAFGAAGQIGRKILGDGAAEIAGIIGETFGTADMGADISNAAEVAFQRMSEVELASVFDEFTESTKLQTQFSAALAHLVEESNTGKLYVLIDELDRCRPLFAIELLERLKHFMGNRDIVYVIAVDIEQLGNAVSAVYGSKYDGHKYLRRFFPKVIDIRRQNTFKYIVGKTSHIEWAQFLEIYENVPQMEIASLSEAFDLSLRDIDRCIETLTYAAKVRLTPGNNQEQMRKESEQRRILLFPLYYAICLKHLGMAREFEELRYLRGDIPSIIKHSPQLAARNIRARGLAPNGDSVREMISILDILECFLQIGDHTHDDYMSKESGSAAFLYLQKMVKQCPPWIKSIAGNEPSSFTGEEYCDFADAALNAQGLAL